MRTAIRSFARSSAVACLFALTHLCQASSLPGTVLTTPGSTVLPGTVPPGTPTGTLLSTLFTPYSFTSTSGTTSGTLLSAVYRNPSGTLDFYYQVVNSFNSTTSIARQTNSNFQGFQTYTGVRTDSVGPFVNGTALPITADSNPSGSVVGFSFTPSDANKVPPGQASAILVISTNASNYSTGQAAIIDGGTQTVAAFQPAVGPLPPLPDPVIYATEEANRKIVLVNVTTGVVTDYHLTPDQPYSLVLDKFGRTIYDERTVNQLRVFNPATNTDTLLADVNEEIDPRDMVLTPDGNFVLVSNTAGGFVTKTNISTGATTILTQVPRPTGIAFDKQGNLFVLDGSGEGGTDSILQIDPNTGAILKNSGPFDFTGTLNGLVFDPFSGFLYATAQSADSVFKINPATLAATQVGAIDSPLGLITDGQGLLYVSSADTHVYAFNVTTNVATQLPPASGVPGLTKLGAIVATAPSFVKAFGAQSIAVGGTTSLNFTITNLNGSPLTAVGFTDTLPSGLLVATPSGATNNCGGTLTATAGSASVSLSGGSIAAGASCVVSVNVTGTSAGTKNNTTSAVTSFEGGTGSTASASIAVVAPPAFSKSFTPAAIPVNANSTLSFTIVNPAANTVPLNGIGFTDNLPSGIVVATPNGLTGSCASSGVITAASGSSSITLTGASLPVGVSCTFGVNITATSAGFFTNTTTPVTSSNGGTGNAASANLTVGGGPVITKSFGASTIPLNGTTSLSFNIINPGVTSTPITGVAFTDALPAGLVVATPSGATGSCDGGTFTAVAGSSTVSLTGATLTGFSSSGTPCSFSVNVTGTTTGAKDNSVTVTSSNAGTGNTSTASVTVVGSPTFTKAFGAATVPLNGSTTLSFNITNPSASFALTGIAFTDTLPSGLVVATPAGVKNTCGGTITAVDGSNTVSLSGGSIPPGASCSLSTGITATSPGTKNNTTGVLTSTQGGTGPTASATIVVVAPPAITKAFTPSTVPVNGTTSLSFNITNPAANTVALTGVAFTDTLPTGIIIATPNGLTGSCGNGVIAALAGSNTISLSGASIPVSGSCTFAVNVIPTASSTFINTTSPVTSTNGGTGNTASATLGVGSAPNITKTFGTSSIPVNGTTSLNFVIASPPAGVPSLTGVGFTDTLPPGLVVATPNALTGSCGNGAITAIAGAGSVSLGSATVTASTNCSFSVNVVGTTAGAKINSVTVTSSSAGTGNTSTATLTVSSAPTITKSFGASSVPLNGTTTLTFNIANPNDSALSGIGFTDTLPSGLVVSTPNGATNGCGGTLTAVAGSSSISLVGGALVGNSSGPSPASTFRDSLAGRYVLAAKRPVTPRGTVTLNPFCSITVNVTGTSPGTKNNTTSAITSTEGGSGTPASASIAVVAPAVISKVFTPATIAANGTTSLSFTITNPAANTVALTGIAFTDTLPTGLVVNTPNGLTGSCGNGVIAAVAASSTVSMTGASLPVGGSCTFAVNVKANASGAFTNTTGAVTSTNGGTGNTASANLAVGSAPTITKAFGAATIPLNGSTTLTFTVTNPSSGSIALTGVAFTDTLPAGLVVATPNGLTGGCGSGTITAASGSSTVSLSGVTLASGASCSLAVNVTGTTTGAKTNSVTVTSTNGGTGNTSTATLNVASAPAITKAFGAASIPLNSSTTLSFNITNPNGNLALSGVGFTDTLPAGLVISTPNGAKNTCAGTITTVDGSNSISLVGGTLPAGATCSLSVGVTGTTAGTKNNVTSVVTSTEGGNGTAASASIVVIGPPSITKAFSPSTIPINGTSTLTLSITNPNSVAMSGIAFTDNLPSGLLVATPNGLTGGCGNGVISAVAGSAGVSMTGANLPPSGLCVVSVNVTATAPGSYTNTTTVTSTTGGTGNTATATLSVGAAPAITKTFGATTIPLNGTTSLSFTISNPAVGSFSLTGVGFTDTLPTGLVVATPNGLTGACGGGTITAVAGSSTVSLGGATLTGLASSGTNSCTFTVNVTGTTVGTKTNTVTVASANGGTGNTSTATISVVGPPTFTKTFGAPSIPLNGTTTLTFNLSNPNLDVPLNQVGFTDTLPSGLVIATPNGATNTCLGTLTAVAGTDTITLIRGVLGVLPPNDIGSTTEAAAALNRRVRSPKGTSVTNPTCTVTVNVTGTTVGTKNNVTTAVTSFEGGTGTTASATIAVLTAPLISKAFSPSTIPVTGTSTLTFSITNPTLNTAALTGVAFTDQFPAGIVVATPSGVTGTCGNGVITATAGAGGLSLTGGTIPAGGTCTFAVNVTASVSGNLTNTTGPVTSTNGGVGNAASATLSVGTPATISKAFGATTIPLNGTTSLTFTISNPPINSISLTGVAFVDTLPAGLVVASPNGLNGSCGGGTITAVPGSSTVSLAGATLTGTILSSVSCSFSVNVTGTTAGAKNNSVTVTSANAGTGNTATATVTVIAPPTLTKAFAIANIPLNGSTTLTFSLANPNRNALSGVGFTDALPAGLVVSTPNGATNTCGGTLAASGGSITLSGATLAVSGTCSLSVSVTGTTPGTKNNTTAAVTSTEGGTGAPATASIVVAAPPVITKAFAPASVPLNGTATLTFTITNPAANTIPLSGISIADSFPVGIVVATPSAVTGSCGNGVIAAGNGSSGVTLTGGSLAANASCSFSVNVKAVAVGAQANCVTVNSTSGGTGNQSCATLTVAPTLTFTSACPAGGTLNSPFTYAATVTGGVAPYTFTLLGGPTGLTINQTTGLVSGTPTSPGQGSLSIRVTDSGTPPSQQTVTQSCGISIASQRLQITSSCPASPLPQGSPFSETLTATGGDGNFTWSISVGSLPPGLTLVGNRIGGSPTGPPGTTNFTIQVTSTDQTATLACSLTVTGPKLQITSGCPADGTVGVAYPAFPLTATGGTGAFVFSIVNGSLPAGLTLTGNAIGGTPQGPAGPSSFTIQATSGDQTATAGPCTVNIAQPALAITGTCPASAQVGTPVSATVTATGGKAPYTFSFTGSPFLTFTNGTISGTPTSAGTGTFSVSVNDSANSPSKTFACSFPVTTGLAISGSCPAAPVTLGQPFSVALSGTGGVAPYKWTLSGQPFMSLSSTTGSSVTVSGTAPAAGTFSFSVTLADSAGTPVATFNCTITVIAAAPTLQIAADPGCPASPIAFQSGVSISLTASGGTAPYSWALSGPSFLSLSTSSGTTTVLSGKASVPGTASFTVTLTDSANTLPAMFSCSLTVTPPPIPPITITGTPTGTPGGGTPGSNPLAPVAISISLPSPSPVDLHGMIQLTFIPNASNPVDNPQVHFSDPCLRLCSFTIPAGTQTITFPNVEQGTVAGTIHLEIVQLLAGDVSVLPPSHPSQDLVVAATKPVITSMVFQNETATGFDIVLGGYSTPRNMTSATITFTAKAGMQFDGDSTFTLSLSNVFNTFYQSAKSVAAGSTFDGLRIPVSISGDKNVIGSVTVTLTNSVGTSDPMTLPR